MAYYWNKSAENIASFGSYYTYLVSLFKKTYVRPSHVSVRDCFRSVQAAVKLRYDVIVRKFALDLQRDAASNIEMQ